MIPKLEVNFNITISIFNPGRFFFFLSSVTHPRGMGSKGEPAFTREDDSLKCERSSHTREESHISKKENPHTHEEMVYPAFKPWTAPCEKC